MYFSCIYRSHRESALIPPTVAPQIYYYYIQYKDSIQCKDSIPLLNNSEWIICIEYDLLDET